ncbi:MAG: NfeD family protein [Planctomycetota bacterium]
MALIPLRSTGAVLQEGDQQQEPDSQRAATLIQVPLPVTSSSAQMVQSALERILEKAPDPVRPQDRDVVVLEFDNANGKTGQGSDLEACQKLVRFMVSPEMNRLNVVAYLPPPRGYVDGIRADGELPGVRLVGHAVLIAMAAEQIAMASDSAMGNADIDSAGDNYVISMYDATTTQKLRMPAPVVMAMVDSGEELRRVETPAGYEFANATMFDEIVAAGDELSSASLSPAGETAILTANQLNEFRLIDFIADSRNDLARQLNVPSNSLEGDPTLGAEWDAVQINLAGYVDSRTIQWILRALDKRSPNLILFRIDASGGDSEDCLRLASRIAGYNPSEIRTVAYIEGEARGAVAAIALTCDHLVMAPDSTIGGILDPPVEPETIESTLPTIQEIASTKGRDWSITAAMLNPELEVTRYRSAETLQQRLLSELEYESLPDKEKWRPADPLSLVDGIDANTAEMKLMLSRNSRIENMEMLQSAYQLESEPVSLEPTLADRWVENAARYLASPFIAPWLLFGAVFFISTEMSAPGVGVPGFIGTLCLVLFFWSQFLEGNADLLEILLFIVGVIFLAMEIFILPGVGIFGIGGVIMIVVSIVLASQTFVFPTTAAEMKRLPVSLSAVAAAGMGFFAAAMVLRKVLPNTPYLNRMMLKPPKQPDDIGIGGRDPEATADWSHLEGRTGVTISRLNPGGKARIAGEVVDVITPGLMIDKGAEVKVIHAVGNRIEVRPVD